MKGDLVFTSYLTENIRCEGNGVVMYGGYMDLHVSVVDEFSGGCGERGCMVEKSGTVSGCMQEATSELDGRS